MKIKCITEFDYHNGRLCFGCDQQLSPDKCDRVTLCDQDRVSLIRQYKSLSKHSFSVLCQSCLLLWIQFTCHITIIKSYLFNLTISDILYEFLFYHYYEGFPKIR